MQNANGSVTFPTVTVVIPTYNRHQLLRRCVHSVVDDIRNDPAFATRLRVIIADDGSSSTEALEVLAELENDIPSSLLRVLRLPANSGGAAVPRNAALDVLQGDYVFFVDSDDFLGRSAIRKLLTLLESHEPDYIYLNSVNVGKRTDSSGAIKVEYEERDRLHALRSLVVRRVFRMSVIRRLGLRFDEYLKSGQDVLFAFQFLLNAKVFGFAGGYEYYNLVAHKSEREEEHLSRKISDDGLSWALRASYSVHTLLRGLVELSSVSVSQDEREKIAATVLLPRTLKQFRPRLGKTVSEERRVGVFRDMVNVLQSDLFPKDALSRIDQRFEPMVQCILSNDLKGFLKIT